VPVTAKLSRRFYEQLGDEIANELVEWFNAVDETYRNQLREINELNWERFRAELKAGLAGQRAELIKWMFGFWIAFWLATVLPLGGLILR
jgi:phosphate uptake regulator